MEERSLGERLKRFGTLGGSVKLNKDSTWIYGFGKDNPNMAKEKLFGNAGMGPLHPGMPYKKDVAMAASSTDTKSTLIRELVEQSSFTRREAEEVVNTLLREGKLIEVDHPSLGKVLVFKGGL